MLARDAELLGHRHHRLANRRQHVQAQNCAGMRRLGCDQGQVVEREAPPFPHFHGASVINRNNSVKRIRFTARKSSWMAGLSPAMMVAAFHLDRFIILTAYIPTTLVFLEGRLRRLLKAERRKAVPENRHRASGPGRETGFWLARRPRARLVTSRSGGPGTGIGGDYDPSAGSLLDWDWRKASSQETRPRDRNRRSGAPRGDASQHMRRARRKVWTDKWRLSAPAPLTFGGAADRTKTRALRAARTMDAAR